MDNIDIEFYVFFFKMLVFEIFYWGSCNYKNMFICKILFRVLRIRERLVNEGVGVFDVFEGLGVGVRRFCCFWESS